MNSYRDLHRRIACLSFANPQYTYYFRGQPKDYWENPNGTTLFPSIYRWENGKKPSKGNMQERFRLLEKAEGLLLEELRNASYWLGFKTIYRYREIRWAILQHYEVCETPLLDITPSLITALAFAKNRSAHGYLYVLGLPAQHDSISYSTQEELFNISLRTTCPPLALRPHLQDACLVGSYPHLGEYYSPAFDVSRRLLVKYNIVWRRFWNGAIRVIDPSALYPKNDDMARVCARVKRKLDKGSRTNA